MKDINYDPIREGIVFAVRKSLLVGFIIGFIIGICFTLLIEIITKS